VTVDERLEALTTNLQIMSREIQALVSASQQDGERIRALARG